MKDSTVQKLAAYSTIKAMADSSKYKNQYYVLAEFIKFLIAEFDLYSFSIIEIIDILSEEFDFSIPYAVCKASLKRIAGLRRTGDEYTVISKETVSDDFEQINTQNIQGDKGEYYKNEAYNNTCRNLFLWIRVCQSK